MEGYRRSPSNRPRQAPAAQTTPQHTETGTGSTRRHRPDYWILLLSVILLVIGLVVVYAISPALSASSGGNSTNFVTHQLLAIGLSVLAFAITSQLPLSAWKRFQKPLIIAAVIATLLALVIPVNLNYPAHRWVRLGGLSFQSVELVKFALVIWLAGFLTKRSREGLIGDFKVTLRPLLVILVVGGLIIAGKQSDLGSAGVMVAIIGAMAFVAGLPMKRVLLIGAVIVIGVILAVASTPYRRERLFAYMHPSANCQTSGYQACQALIAVGSGGFVGLGLGRSVQAYGYLPEAANDSIFAIYAEKFGFIGSIVLLLIFTALFARLTKVAERAPDPESRLLVIGVLSWLSVQAIINIGAMIGLLPLKGITLPFISYGGTSVVFMAAAVGLVFHISRYTSFVSPLEAADQGRRGYDNSRDRRRLGRPHYADLSSR
jgi:cell division protein FtsW